MPEDPTEEKLRSFCKLQHLLIDFNSRFSGMFLINEEAEESSIWKNADEFTKFNYILNNLQKGALYKCSDEMSELILTILNQFDDDLEKHDRILNAYSIQRLIKEFLGHNNLTSREEQYKDLRLVSVSICEQINLLTSKIKTLEECIEECKDSTPVEEVEN